jgi:lon-related putative ATP-dependent protease
MAKKYELPSSKLRSICNPAQFKFKNTGQVSPLDGVIGQERAVRAIGFGLNMNSPGYNIFVSGVEGTGKSTIVKYIVTQHAKNRPAPDDWCMVNNFKDEFCPKTISVPSSKANLFKKQIDRFINDLKVQLPKAFADKSFQKKTSEIKEKYSKKQQQLFQKLDQSAAKKYLMINRTQTGFQTIPLADGKPMTPEAFQTLPEDKQAEINDKIHSLQTKIEATLRGSNKLSHDLQTQIDKLMEEMALFVVKNRIDMLRNRYKDSHDILDYLNEVQEDIVENVDRFIKSKKDKAKAENLFLQSSEPYFQEYRVNVLVDHKQEKGAPVIFETNPTYNNVFGHIEKRAYMGTLMTDFTMVQAGSLLKANGGYLIMEIESVLMSPYVWEALKRALQNKLLFIEDLASGLGMGTSSLRPEPISLDVKVVLIGSYHLFQTLQNHDSKFNKIFKVRADFDYEVERNENTVKQYAQFIARTCKEENLLSLSPKGVAAVVEYGEKQISDKNKLSLRFGQIQGILKEADYWAREKNARTISEKYVEKVLNEHKFRHNLYEEKVHESYRDETILLDVKEDVVGQVNALAVYQIGENAFGRPSRITAETYMGKAGIINIERESKLSGKTHDKGILILSGFLGRTFAQSYPLSLSISITFEQSYGGIDGDSASSTELYAILSSLSDIPINQGIAVTGSVNQKGMIQAIGGVNEKIEGFFDVCKTKGITGKQGVIIPVANVKNLMLKKEVIDAVKKKKFHIYQVATAEEGIEILTGVPAGKPDKQGNYPEKTVFKKVQDKLKRYLERTYEIKKWAK